MINIIAETPDQSPPPEPGQLHVECLSTFSELAPFRDEWDTFVERVGSDIYFTVDWLETWWKYYGSERQLRCFLVRVGRQLVAALPFCVQVLRLGPLPIKVARLVGADSAAVVLSPPIEPGQERIVLAHILRRLLVDEQCSMASLSPLFGAPQLAEAAREVCTNDADFHLQRDAISGLHAVIRLPERIDAFIAALSRRQRSNYRRDLNNLCKQYQIEYRVIAGPQAAEHFDEFIRMHQDQWQTDGRLGHFGDWPDSEAFNRELVMKLSLKGRARLYQLIGDSNVLAMDYGFVLGDRYYARLGARRCGREYDRLGLGRVCFVKAFEALIDEGVSTVEAGAGHYEYKARLGGEELPLRQLVIARSSINARIRSAALLCWVDLLNLLYYRVWFLKLSPRFPRLHRPLWRTWIRTRL